MKRMLLSLAVAMLFATSALAQIIRVPADQPTIQAAINAAANGDTVLVADGTYYENINFKGKAITVASHFLMDADTSHISNTIIDGSRPSHPDSGSVVYFIAGEDTASVLYGFTITGGTGTINQTYNDRYGAGISMYNSGGRISHNKIIHNTITYERFFGVGILVVAMSGQYAIIENNIVHSNTGYGQDQYRNAGGGIGVEKEFAGEVKIVNNRIYNNILISNAGYLWAAGIFCYSLNPGGKVIVSGNFVGDNVCQPSAESGDHTGAGIIMRGGEMRLFDNIIVNNRFVGNYGYGGGVSVGNFVDSGVNVWDTRFEIYNNIIAGNSAKHGGGIFFLNIPTSSIKFVNNTVIGNTAGYQGGGIFVSKADPVVLNNILWNNSAPNGPEIFLWESHITVRYSDVQGGWSGEGNIDADPRLVADSLSNDSPCIGAGIDVYDFGDGVVLSCPPYDINGRLRPSPAGSKPDMGAWESKWLKVSVESEPQVDIPKTYALGQNYPNPFNPSTSIEFALPKPGFVTLKIYNTLGEEVATLVSEKLPAGKHQRVWEAKGLASGVYVYRLEVGDPSASFPSKPGQAGHVFEETRKLILLR